MIDWNDGTLNQENDLAFTEFDPTLRSCLNFRSESCLKALFMGLGVEEMRAALAYQVM